MEIIANGDKAIASFAPNSLSLFLLPHNLLTLQRKARILAQQNDQEA